MCLVCIPCASDLECSYCCESGNEYIQRGAIRSLPRAKILLLLCGTWCARNTPMWFMRKFLYSSIKFKGFPERLRLTAVPPEGRKGKPSTQFFRKGWVHPEEQNLSCKWIWNLGCFELQSSVLTNRPPATHYWALLQWVCLIHAFIVSYAQYYYSTSSCFSMVLQTTESWVSLGLRVGETKFHVYSLAVRWCQSLVNGSNFKLIVLHVRASSSYN